MKSGNSRRIIWISVAGAVGLVLLCAVIGNFVRDDDPRGYIREHYQRASRLDRPDGGFAYTSTRSQAAVVSALRRNTDERDHRRTDGIDFLQYDEHIVAVSRRSAGSMIYVDDYRDAYRHYSTQHSGFYLFGWSSSPPGFSGFRGGGGGFGK